MPSGASFSKDQQGTIPLIIQSILDERNRIRFEEMPKFKKNSFEYTNLHYRQYAFKVLANSMYGIMGAKFSRYFKKEIAEGITLTGQYLIKMIWKWFKDQSHLPIYGDTDSIFVILKNKADPKKICQDVKIFLDNDLKKFNINENFLKLDFKEEFIRFIPIAKKKYVGILEDGEIEVTGIESKKRDSLPIAGKWQIELLDLLLKTEATEQDLIEWVDSKKELLEKRQIDIKDFIFQKRLGKEIEEYGKSSDSESKRKVPIPVHVKVAMKVKEKQGKGSDKINLYSQGSYIPYIVIDSKNGISAVHPSDFDGNYDIQYYWNACFAPSQRILEAVYQNIDWETLKIKQKYEQKSFF